jgi:hypothetical protein
MKPRVNSTISKIIKYYWMIIIYTLMYILVIKDYLVSKINFRAVIIFLIKRSLKSIFVWLIGVNIPLDIFDYGNGISIDDQNANVKQEPGNSPDLSNIPLHNDPGTGGSGSPGPSKPPGNNDSSSLYENIKKEEEIEGKGKMKRE